MSGDKKEHCDAIELTIHPKGRSDLCLGARLDSVFRGSIAFLARTKDVTDGSTVIWQLSKSGHLTQKSTKRCLVSRSKKHKYEVVTRERCDNFSQNWTFLSQEDESHEAPSFVIFRWYDLRCLQHKNKRIMSQPRPEDMELRNQSWFVRPKNATMLELHDFLDSNFLNLDPSKWMTQLSPYIGPKMLRKIVIPGTHDSATSTLTAKSAVTPDAPSFCKKSAARAIDGIICDWSKAQSMSISRQLRAGIRYFDIRTCKHNGDFYTCHGMAGVPLENVITDIAHFLNSHPDEVVIIIMDHFYDMDLNDHSKLQDLILNILGTKLHKRVERRPKAFNITLRELQQQKHQAILFYKPTKLQGHLELWPCSKRFYDSVWPNTTELKILKSRLDAVIQSHCGEDVPQSLWVVQGVMTPTENTITKGLLTPMSPDSLETLAVKTNPNLRDWLKSEEWINCENFNIVIADWVEIGGFVASCIHRNVLMSLSILNKEM